MAPKRKQTEVGDYRHDEERLNNPPAGKTKPANNGANLGFEQTLSAGVDRLVSQLTRALVWDET